jgi:hypothetical protein
LSHIPFYSEAHSLFLLSPCPSVAVAFNVYHHAMMQQPIQFGDGPEAYEKISVPAFSGVWAKDLVKQAALQKNERVLDRGSGSGIVARYAEEHDGETGEVEQLRTPGAKAGLEVDGFWLSPE